MAGSVNKVIIVGHLGADPEVRFTAGGQAVATLNVATNERFQKDGNWEDRTEWHRVVAWAKTAERCKQYAKKGTLVYLEGRLQTRSWEDREGNKRFTTEVVAQTIQFLSGMQERGAASSAGDDPGPAQAFQEEKGKPDLGPADDDFPF